MVKIPQREDPTLEAMYKAVEKNAVNEQRDYLGASLIGEPCARKIWYNVNGFEQSPSSHIGLMAADSGYYAEDKTAERLRLVEGIELHTHMPNGEQYGWEQPVSLSADPEHTGAKMAGHYDGLIRGLLQAPKTIHIWEHKDKDHKKFADFQRKKQEYGEKNALREWNINYYAQAQVNMHFCKIDGKRVNRHYMTVSYAGGRKYDSCRTEYDETAAMKYIERGEKILRAIEAPPRINETPDYYLCRFCNFKGICHA